MSLYPVQLTPELLDYCLKSGMIEAPSLSALRQRTAELPMGVMQSSPIQGQLLALFVRMIGARQTLDIGVFTGYSAVSVALALPDDGRVIACDTNEASLAVGKPFWQQAGVDEKIQVRLAPAHETLTELLATGAAGQFDFAFIDADKARYDDYYELCLQLLRAGGVIVLDNMLDQGKVANPDIQTERVNRFRYLNEKIRDDARVDACLVPVADGMHIALKK